MPSATIFPSVAELDSLSEGFANSSFAETDHLVGEIFKAASEYLDELAERKFFNRIMADSIDSWRRLKFIVITPKKPDVDHWASGPRGRDFGRAETVEAITMLSGPGLNGPHSCNQVLALERRRHSQISRLVQSACPMGA